MPEDMQMYFCKYEVIQWDKKTGFGHLKNLHTGQPILFHVTALRAGGFQFIRVGETGECEVLSRLRGDQAYRILSIDQRVNWWESQRV